MLLNSPSIIKATPDKGDVYRFLLFMILLSTEVSLSIPLLSAHPSRPLSSAVFDGAKARVRSSQIAIPCTSITPQDSLSLALKLTQSVQNG